MAFAVVDIGELVGVGVEGLNGVEVVPGLVVVGGVATDEEEGARTDEGEQLMMVRALG